jgi:repressor LexA
MKNVLTEKQEAVLNFIEKFQLENGKSPTIKEMREAFGLKSDNSILKHLNALTEKGYLEKDDTPRGIKLLESVKAKLSGATGIKLPVLGAIPAGGPVIAEENINGWMSVGEDIASNSKDYFLLEVTGQSMIDAGIYEGDLVVIDTKKTPKNGDIVVALVDGANTLKRLIKEGNQTYLRAENKNYKDIYPEDSLQTQGVVTSLIRQY